MPRAVIKADYPPDEASANGYLVAHKGSISLQRQRQCDFLLLFMKLQNEYGAARELEIANETILNWKKSDPWFRSAMIDAEAMVAGVILNAVNDRAINGWWEPVVSGGQVMTFKDEEDGGKVKVLKKFKYDSLLLQKLAAHRIPGFAQSSKADDGEKEPQPGGTGIPDGSILISPEDAALIKPVLEQIKKHKALQAAPE